MTQPTVFGLRGRMVWYLVIVVVALLALWTVGLAGADAPQAPDVADSSPAILNYQGLVQVDGKPYSGPTGHFKFAIVDAPTGNGATNYWANDGQASGQPGAAIPLPVSEGLFNVLLGDTGLSGMTEEVDAMDFSAEPTYLRVWFSATGNPGSFGALEPNQRIASVPHALRAERAHRVDGFHASASPMANRLIALDGSAYLHVPRVVDSGNASFYVDPSSTSVLTSLDVRKKLHNGGAVYVEVNDGLHVLDPAVHGVWVSGADDDGVNVSSAAGDGLHVGTAGAYGVNVYEAAKSGVYVGTTDEYGVHINEPDWSGVFVEGTDASGLYVENAGWGLYIESASHYGVNARGNTAGGYFRDADSGVYAYTGYGNYGIYSNGTIRGSNISTAQPHPKDGSRMIVYGALEGGETGTYFRGSASLDQGTAIVRLPEHFGLVTEDEGLTVQVTPRADCQGLYVAEATTRQIVVKELQGGTSDAPFDFTINGVRAGYAAYQVMQNADVLLPDGAGDPKRGQPDG